MATGLPVIVTACDGSAEAVASGVNGFLVPPGEPQSLAQQVLVLLDNPALIAQMGAAGRQRAQEFSDQGMVAAIANLYQELLREKGLQDGV